ncbi:MAG: GNAT family N-acetyltransferase [Thermoguttaceae bacterium]|nr:GNAT family N-acetyltransferase [Thermoguttaceae bacterium]
MIKTERLTIRIASDDEMRGLISEETDPELKKAYGEMLGLSRANPDSRQWFAAWLIRLPDGTRVGDLCFKGLSPDGGVEIGYGILPEYQGKGYATETVSAAARWASNQPGVQFIEAETDPENGASQAVLKKAGFVPTGKIGGEGPRFRWRGD